MKIIADTNVLLRAVVADDEAQSRLAIEALESAEMVAVSSSPSASSHGCFTDAMAFRAQTLAAPFAD